jgi:hypothetical protein
MHVIRLVEACRTDRMELLNDSTLILIAKNPGAAHPRDFLFFLPGLQQAYTSLNNFIETRNQGF